MPEPNYGRHEVLHMASFLVNAVDSELIEHEVIKAHPEWLALAEQAANALFDLYQAIGQEAAEDAS